VRLPCFYDLILTPLEWLGLRRLRRYVLRPLQGRVLEIGSGTGLNAGLFPTPSELEIIALEPSGSKIHCAGDRKTVAPYTHWVRGAAENLPFGEHSFDMVCATLVLCTVKSLPAALAELKRVLKPDGRLILLEHVRPRQPWLGRIFDWLSPAWEVIAEGCHLNRQTGKILEQGGFNLEQEQSFFKGIVKIFAALPNSIPAPQE